MRYYCENNGKFAQKLTIIPLDVMIPIVTNL